MKVHIILLLSLCIVFVQSTQLNTQYQTINKALESFTKIVISYDEKLDHSAKFPELQAAIDAIAASMQDYKGKAESRLPLIKKYNTDAKVNYASCVGPVFEWCVAMNTTLDIFVKYIDEGMSVKDRRIAWNLAGRLLRQGLDKTTTSLRLLEDVQKTMGYLETELKDLLDDINFDFSPEGEYGHIRTCLMNDNKRLQSEIEQENQKQENARAVQKKKKTKKAVLTFLFSMVFTIVTGPVGAALGLPLIFSKAGMNLGRNPSDPFDYQKSDALIDDYEKQRQDIEEKVKAIQLLFNVLKEKTQEAVNIAREVKTALEKESTHLHSLKGLIQAAETQRVALLSDNEQLRRDLIPTFRKLGASCLQYSVRHGYAAELVQNSVTRKRRQAVNQCQKNKELYAKMFVESMPINTTVNGNEQHDIAQSIVNNMECSSVYYLTTFRNSPDTLVSNDVRTSRFVNKPSESILLSMIKNIQKPLHLLNM